MIKIIIAVVILITMFFLFYWFLVAKKTQPQAELSILENVEYDTSLFVDVDSSMPENLILRRLRDSTWLTSGEHTDFQSNEYIEPSMSVVNIKPDAYLKSSIEEPARILLGRLNDTGSGMHGWHVTMIREGDNLTAFDRHQRYRVWIDKDFPIGFTDDGEPISVDTKRWFFSGPADIISQEHYNGYLEPADGDK